MNLEDLKEKHLEAIDNQINHCSHFFQVEAAYDCAKISEHHGKIQYLKGMIEAYEVWDTYEEYSIIALDKIEEIQKQLEALKNEL